MPIVCGGSCTPEPANGFTECLLYTRDYLEEVRESALILLYRLLFLFYAEDRSLLPARDPRYATYSVRRLRERVRDDVDAGKVMSTRIDNLWRDLQGVFTLIDQGDDAVGMPAYNGGLFDRARAPLLERTRVPDAVMAPIIDALSRRTEEIHKLWINYRDLSVSHLGGIYERLLEYTLEHEVQAGDNFDLKEINRIVARPASFARKVSGSYYTHDDLVRLLLRESVGVMAQERLEAFVKRIAKLKKKQSISPPEWDLLDKLDPASAILELHVCDPAMGSGHFLVLLVDDLADRVLEAINTAEQLVSEQKWAAHLVEQGRTWQSPLVARLAAIRGAIRRQAGEHGWAVTDAQLDDRHIVRRMILKKCIFGVDKNPMAVELAKTALWLHTFTVGAPLSFLDHHLKCGDSLHGERLDGVQRTLSALGMLFQQADMHRMDVAARSLVQIADLTDVDIAEAQRSKQLAADADDQVAPLHALLDFWRSLRWMLPGWPVESMKKLAKLGDERVSSGLAEILSPQRNLVALLADGCIAGAGAAISTANELLAAGRTLTARERFFHWWTTFPTVFGPGGRGGFDVVVGNPPWDRIKLQEVEWFAERDARIAQQARAADRKRMIGQLQEKQSPLWADYRQAVEATEANARVLGKSGDYPLLGGGDVNLYSLFVERATALIHDKGLVALLTPSGIAADKGAAEFFRGISATGRLGALFDFENRHNPGGSYFPDVDSRFKFCALVFGGSARKFAASRCAFYLQRLEELDDKDRTLELSAEDFRLVNPNTGAAPIFRSRRDAEITSRIYHNHPVLVNRSAGGEQKAWPVRYLRMFDMTNDSNLFLTRVELEKKGFAPGALNRWTKGDEEVLPLYVGRMIHQYDHRFASVTVNEENLHNVAIGVALGESAKADPDVYPVPQYWVRRDSVPAQQWCDWVIGFRDITRATDVRTMIAAVVPSVFAGNTLPLLIGLSASDCCSMLANINSVALDYVCRQKAQTTHVNWYILEQLPVISPERFEARIGGVRIADFIREQVLHLSYTAHDLAPFARDLGYDGPPFRWDEAERRQRIAALDALFMNLYGLNEDDAAYILDSFPIVREQDEDAFGDCRTKKRVLDGMRQIAAGCMPVVDPLPIP